MSLIQTDPYSWVDKYRLQGYSDQQLVAAASQYGVDITEALRAPQVGSDRHTKQMLAGGAARPDDVYGSLDKGVIVPRTGLTPEFGIGEENIRGAKAIGNAMWGGATREMPSWFAWLAEQAVSPSYQRVEETNPDADPTMMPDFLKPASDAIRGYYEDPISDKLHESGVEFLDRAKELQPGKEGRLDWLYGISASLDAIPAVRIQKLLDFSDLGRSWGDAFGSPGMKEWGGIKGFDADAGSAYVDDLLEQGLSAQSEAAKTTRITQILNAIDEAPLDQMPEKAVSDAVDGILYKDGVPDYGISDAVVDGVTEQLTAVDDALKLSVVEERFGSFMHNVKSQADSLIKKADVPNRNLNGKRDPKDVLMQPPPADAAEAMKWKDEIRALYPDSKSAKEGAKGVRSMIRRHWLDSQQELVDWAKRIPQKAGDTILAVVKRRRGMAGINNTWMNQGTFFQAEGGEMVDMAGRLVKNEADMARYAQRGETVINGASFKDLHDMADSVGKEVGRTGDEVMRDILSEIMPAQRVTYDFHVRQISADRAQIVRGELMKAKTALNDAKNARRIQAEDYEKQMKGITDKLAEQDAIIERAVPSDAKADQLMARVLAANRHIYGDQWSKIESLAHGVRDLADRQVLQPYVQQGLMTPQNRALIRQENPFWVPFNKTMDAQMPKIDVPGAPPTIQKGKTAQGFGPAKQGFNEYTIDPSESFIKRMNDATMFREEQFLIREVVNQAHTANVQALRTGMGRSEMITLVDERPVGKADMLDDGLESLSMSEAQLSRQNAMAGGIQPKGDKLRFYTINDKGQEVVQYWGGNDDLVRAILDSDRAALKMVGNNIVMSGLKLSARYQRLGFTTNMAFMTRNIIRDPQTLNVFSKYTSIPFYNTFQGLIEQARLGPIWMEYLRNGFSHSNLLAQNARDAATSLAEATAAVKNPFTHPFTGIHDIFKSEMGRVKGDGIVGHIGGAARGARDSLVHGLQEWGGALENASRVGHLKHLRKLEKRGYGGRHLGALDDAWRAVRRAKKFHPNMSFTRKEEVFREAYGKAKSETPTYLDALSDVREGVIDFNRMGVYGSFYNSIEPFFNANLQDAAKFAQVFSERPVATTLKVANGITLPSVILWMQNHDNQDYKDLKQWEKDLYWHLGQNEKGEWYKIPKPFLPGVMWGSMVERFLTYAVDKDPEGVRAGLRSLVDVSPLSYVPLAPSMTEAFTGGENVEHEAKRQFYRMMPGYAQPVLESVSNFSEFKDRPIVPEHLEGAEGREIYDADTPMAYRKVADAAYSASRGNLSLNPLKLQYLLEQTTGLLGEGAVQALETLAFRKEKPYKEDWYREWVGFRGISNAVIGRPGIGMGSEPVNKFYTTKKVLSNIEKTERLKRSRDDDDYYEFADANYMKLQAAKEYRKTGLVLGELFDDRERILQDPLLTNAQKKRQRDAIDKEITEIARQMNTDYKEVYLD